MYDQTVPVNGLISEPMLFYAPVICLQGMAQAFC